MNFRTILLSFVAGCAALLAAQSCTKVSLTAEDFISSVEFAKCDNALRVPIDLTFNKPCFYQVEYWAKDAPQKKYSTRKFQSLDGKGHLCVMFLYPTTTYEYCLVVDSDGTEYRSGTSAFITGALPVDIPDFNLSYSYPNTEIPGYIMQMEAKTDGYLTFCDTDGNIVWYEKMEDAIRQAYYDPESRTVAMNLGFKTGQNSKFQRLGAEIVLMDLEGNRIIDMPSSPQTIDLPHHEIKQMPDGNLLFLHNVVKKFDMTSRGGSAEEEVYGEGFSIVTKDFRTIWTWDCFRELDPVNDEYLYDNGSYSDLIHSNSVAWDDKGHYYMTSNHLSELWKIDAGTGDVLYRLGPNGNIKIDEDCFANGLHAAVVLGEDKILCLDNGRDTGVSRALVYEINAASRTAHVSLNVAIPAELSSRDRSNVCLSKDGKMLYFGSTQGRAGIFTDLDGNVLKVITRKQISYRSYYYEDIEY